MDQLLKIEKMATQPIINFSQYDTLIQQATQVAEYIDNVQLTDENVAECKQIVADARKSINKLDDQRKAIKRYINEPYEKFNEQCKDIQKIVSDSENALRKKINAYDESIREAKKEELQKIWNTRAPKWSCSNFVTFDKWLTPQHLNKSMSMDKCEQDMVNFLQSKEQDVHAIETMSNADEIMVEYQDCLDLTTAVTIVNERIEKNKEVNKKMNIEKFTLEINSKVEFELAKKLLDENGIVFKVL